MATTIEKISHIRGKGMPDPGTLTVDGDAIEFRGKHETIRLTGIRQVRHGTTEGDTGSVYITYGDGGATEKFFDLRRGKLHTGAQAKVLTQELRSLLGISAPSADQLNLEATVALAAAKRTMLIAGVVLLVGIVVTAFTYSRAEGGGSYVVAWGAILYGAAYSVAGIVRYRKATKALQQAGGAADTAP